MSFQVAFDDEGNAMTAFEKIAQGSANAETQTVNSASIWLTVIDLWCTGC